jgi:hypothetical protein
VKKDSIQVKFAEDTELIQKKQHNLEFEPQK